MTVRRLAVYGHCTMSNRMRLQSTVYTAGYLASSLLWQEHAFLLPRIPTSRKGDDERGWLVEGIGGRTTLYQHNTNNSYFNATFKVPEADLLSIVIYDTNNGNDNGNDILG